jgi:hypothetical protein
MIDGSKTTLERAFELARSGDCSTVVQIKARLQSEGYMQDQVTGNALRSQLLKIMRAGAAQPAAEAAVPAETLA